MNFAAFHAERTALTARLEQIDAEALQHLDEFLAEKLAPRNCGTRDRY